MNNSLNNIYAAYGLIKDHVIKTDVRRIEWLHRYLGVNIYAKLENQQISGSFKFRGASNNALINLRNKKNNKFVVASAGGHGLAMALAAEKYGIETIIVVPQTGSQVKKNRIASCKNVSLVKEGDSLESSTKYAIEIAQETGYEFISPYNHKNILEGQGTSAIEFLEQVDDLDCLVVPVGGGGLISGVSIVAKAINPKIKIIGVQVENYASAYESIKNKKITRVVNSPTFADGLAVNLEEKSITLNHMLRLVDDLVLVTEEDIAAAVSSMINHESLLLEGAGAVGIAAIISKKLPNKDLGRKTGVFLTGGNVTRSSLSNMLNYPFRNDYLKYTSGLLGIKTDQEIINKGIDFSSSSFPKDNTSVKIRSQKNDVSEDDAYILSRQSDISEKINILNSKFIEYQNYCNQKEILVDKRSINIINKVSEIVKNEIGYISLPSSDSLFKYSEDKTLALSLYRTLLQLLLQLGPNLDWRSASYNQSLASNFFEISSQENPNVNYNRYESYNLSSLEKHVAKSLRIDLSKYSLLLTSSGMSAYTMIEAFLLRNVLNTGDTILIPHYIYFEIDEQISKLKSFNIKKCEIYETEKIISLIDDLKPKVIFLDPLTNTEELRVIDYETIIKYLDKVDEDVYVIFDGSMLGGQARPEQLLAEGSKVKILYHESCSKYLQLGMDIAMAGLTIFPIEFNAEFTRLRRNTGGILYDHFVYTFPDYDTKILKNRMTRFSSNAKYFTNLVNKNAKINDYVRANYPNDDLHIDYNLKNNNKLFGGIVTFTFKHLEFNNRDTLNDFIEVLLEKCRDLRIQITKGLSFGFSVPRISAAASMAEGSPPFLRLFVGDITVEEVYLLSNAFELAILQFSKNYVAKI